MQTAQYYKDYYKKNKKRIQAQRKKALIAKIEKKLLRKYGIKLSTVKV